MSTAMARSDRELGDAHWESWMRLAADTTFNLIGGAGARPEMPTADIALALAQGSTERLGRTVAVAIATQSLLGWPDVVRYGYGPSRHALLQDRVCAEVVTVDDARTRRLLYTALAASFCDVVAAALPRYRMGARVARARWEHYRATYDVVRDHLQCAADTAAAAGWLIR